MKRFFIFLTLFLGICLVFSSAVRLESMTDTEIPNTPECNTLSTGTSCNDFSNSYTRVDASAADQVEDSLQLCFYIYDIELSIVKKGKNYYAIAVITVMDNYGNPVPNVTVHIAWSGIISGTDSGVTGADGKVTFVSPTFKNPGPIYITVIDAYHPTIPPCEDN